MKGACVICGAPRVRILPPSSLAVINGPMTRLVRIGDSGHFEVACAPCAREYQDLRVSPAALTASHATATNERGDRP